VNDKETPRLGKKRVERPVAPIASPLLPRCSCAMAAKSSSRSAAMTDPTSKSWQEVKLAVPAGIAPADAPAYDVPFFRDAKNGFMAVSYGGPPEGLPSAVVLFRTADAGNTWKIDSMLTGLDDSSAGQAAVRTMGGSRWIVAKSMRKDDTGAVSRIETGQASSITSDSAATYFRGHELASVLSFVTAEKGWMISGSGQLLSTSDGGTTWKEIYAGTTPLVAQF